MKPGGSKTKLFCETSFTIETLNFKNEEFLRDVLQKWSFEAQKHSVFARLPSKIEAQKRSVFARFPSQMTCGPDTWLQNYNTFERFLSGCFKSIAPAAKKLVRGIGSPVTATRNDHCKVTFPWHDICSPSTDSASGFKHRRYKPRNPCTYQAKSIISDPLQSHHACQRFCNPHKFLRLPRILHRLEMSLRLPREKHFELQKTSRAPGALTILTSKSFSRAGVVQILEAWTSKSARMLAVFNDFHFRIALARRRGANFGDSTWKSVPTMPCFKDFDFRIALSRRRGANFGDILSSRSSATPLFRSWLSEAPKPQNNGKTAFRAIPTCQNFMSHISAVSHSHLLADRSSVATLRIVGS